MKKYDLISLGEVMLRLDPGDGRIRNTRSFTVWEGGGEYNVARGLTRCFGLDTAVLTALVDNDIGYLVADLIRQGGVDSRFIHWVPFDGIGKTSRNGLNFTERGFGVRAALGVSDRGHTATSQLNPDDFDWKKIFQEYGTRWLHTGGIFAGLSDKTAEVAKVAMEHAKASGAKVSFDLNYRPSIWKGRGGVQAAQEVNRNLVKSTDVLFGNEEDFVVALGIKPKETEENYQSLSHESYFEIISQTVSEFPHLEKVAITMRSVKSASVNDWTAVAWSKEEGFTTGKEFVDLQILDRVGGGDSFASGFIYAVLGSKSLEECVNYGLAHGALAMTTPGDTSMASKSEVARLVEGAAARVQR